VVLVCEFVGLQFVGFRFCSNTVWGIVKLLVYGLCDFEFVASGYVRVHLGILWICCVNL
jgi:hypothetical protein